MKRIEVFGFVSLIVLILTAGCAESSAADNLLPSWLAEKTWKGRKESSLTVPSSELSEAIAEAFEIKTSSNDIYVPSIYAHSSGDEIEITVIYAKGIKEQLEEAGVGYIEYSNDNKYVIEAKKGKYETGDGNIYFLDVPCTLVIEHISGIQIRYTVSTEGGVVSSPFPPEYNTGDTVTVPAVASTALMTRT